jgi:hypothetical protein
MIPRLPSGGFREGVTALVCGLDLTMVRMTGQQGLQQGNCYLFTVILNDGHWVRRLSAKRASPSGRASRRATCELYQPGIVEGA